MEPAILRVSTLAISDHVSRLYDERAPMPDGALPHVDGEDHGTIRILKPGAATDLVAMSAAAVREFIADMDYQVEFSDGEYRSQCRKALRQVRRQLAERK